jgi:nicotinate-nucleotide adenylyltransferase
MCELAAAGEDGLEACPLEVERGGTSYTVDTLESIHAQHPEARLTFIVGADTARTLGSWREPRRVLALAQLAVATRAGSARREVLDALDAVPRVPEREGAGEALGQRVSFLSMAPVAVSSSMVRERVARGEPIEQLVGPAVARYIDEHGLYGARIGAAS